MRHARGAVPVRGEIGRGGQAGRQAGRLLPHQGGHQSGRQAGDPGGVHQVEGDLLTGVITGELPPPLTAAVRAVREACSGREAAGLVLLGGDQSGHLSVLRAVEMSTPAGRAIRVVGRRPIRDTPYGALLGWIGEGAAAPREDGTRDVAEVLGALRRVWGCSGTPPLVLAQDPGELCQESITVLTHLAAAREIRLVVTARVWEEVPAPFRSLWRSGVLGRYRLRPLTPAEVHDVVREAFGAGPSLAAADELFWLSGGRPLWVLALAHAYLGCGRLRISGDTLLLTPQPARATDAVRVMALRRLTRLAPGTTQALRSALGSLAGGVPGGPGAGGPGAGGPGAAGAPAWAGLAEDVAVDLVRHGYLAADRITPRRHLVLAALALGYDAAALVQPLGWERQRALGSGGSAPEGTMAPAHVAAMVREIGRLRTDPDAVDPLQDIGLGAGVRRALAQRLAEGDLSGAQELVQELGPVRAVGGPPAHAVGTAAALLGVLAGRREEALELLGLLAAQHASGFRGDCGADLPALHAALRDEPAPGRRPGRGGVDALRVAVDLAVLALGGGRLSGSRLLALGRLARLHDDARLGVAVTAVAVLLGQRRHAAALSGAAEVFPGAVGEGLARLGSGLGLDSEQVVYAAVLTLRSGGLCLGPDGLGAAALSVLPGSLTRRLVASRHSAPVQAGRLPSFAGAEQLTPRELLVVSEVYAGLSNADVAQTLNISVRTVEGHLYQVYGKLGIPHRRALVDLVQAEPQEQPTVPQPAADLVGAARWGDTHRGTDARQGTAGRAAAPPTHQGMNSKPDPRVGRPVPSPVSV